MYTPQQAAIELGLVAGAWFFGILAYVWASGSDVRCDGSGCSGHWE